jgi:hypothetical protein
VLVDQAERARPNLQQLANAHVYLSWVNTGALECVEGGGHYRPNHHAELAKTMFMCVVCRGGAASLPGLPALARQPGSAPAASSCSPDQLQLTPLPQIHCPPHPLPSAPHPAPLCPRSLEWAMEDYKWPNALGAFLARKVRSCAASCAAMEERVQQP